MIDTLTKKEMHGEDVYDLEEDEDNGEEKEIDSFSIYKELVDEGIINKKEDISAITDPKIIEGNKIDLESQKYIKSQYPNCELIVLEHMNNDDLTNKTLEILKEKDNVILCQSAFIYKGIAIAKPDGLVKVNGKYILIETKGTTTSKFQHLIDITFQEKVVN
jgi:hypothetical protein